MGFYFSGLNLETTFLGLEQKPSYQVQQKGAGRLDYSPILLSVQHLSQSGFAGVNKNCAS